MHNLMASGLYGSKWGRKMFHTVGKKEIGTALVERLRERHYF